VLHCSEELAGQTTRWRWLFLDDGGLLELAPRGARAYGHHRILERSHPLYQQVVAQDGVLVRFEARVRTGSAAVEPTYLTIDGREYTVQATGTARLERVEGTPPSLAAWSSLAADPAQNVWCHLGEVDGPGAALGLWTHALCLSFGQAVEWTREP
jgi:hypothetical protein